ncbi:MAG: diguanylate cyclase [Anaerofustis sp.]
MKTKFRQIIDKMIIDEDLRIRLQMTVMSGVLFVIALVMFLLNLFEHVKNLTIITGSFSVICLVSFLLLVIWNLQKAVSYLISITTTVMFCSFLLTGGIDGFSPIWICLLPSTSMFFLGMKRGTILSIFMMFVLILSFWTPLSGYLLYDYSSTFMVRFPIVCIGSLLAALALESIRIMTYNKMRETMDLLDRIGKMDELTKIENRRFFDQKLTELWDIVRRSEGRLSMLMIDVDCFKNYNDHYGHIAGDAVLVAVADAIMSVIDRRTDVAARWGGEEFAVLLPLTDSNGARKAAELISEAVRAKQIPHNYTDVAEAQITVSIGVAEVLVSEQIEPDDLLRLSDEALYCAKKEGRNRVVVRQNSVWMEDSDSPSSD